MDPKDKQELAKIIVALKKEFRAVVREELQFLKKELLSEMSVEATPTVYRSKLLENDEPVVQHQPRKIQFSGKHSFLSDLMNDTLTNPLLPDDDAGVALPAMRTHTKTGRTGLVEMVNDERAAPIKPTYFNEESGGGIDSGGLRVSNADRIIAQSPVLSDVLSRDWSKHFKKK